MIQPLFSIYGSMLEPVIRPRVQHPLWLPMAVWWDGNWRYIQRTTGSMFAHFRTYNVDWNQWVSAAMSVARASAAMKAIGDICPEYKDITVLPLIQ